MTFLNVTVQSITVCPIWFSIRNTINPKPSVQAFYRIPKPDISATKTKYHEKTSNIETMANGTTKVFLIVLLYSDYSN